LDVLDNEASVETFFVNRMLKDMGYRDNQIKTKKAISEIAVPRGSKKVNYKPDYILTQQSKPCWVLDAKAPNESLDKWVFQCSGYCLELNQSFEDENPVEFFVLTNGLLSRVYRWDNNKPLIELSFADFSWGNPKFEKWRSILSAASFRTVQKIYGEDFDFQRPSSELAKQIFAQCHRVIWKSEG
jgi:type I restriction enzyme M protein